MFVAKKSGRDFSQTINLENMTIAHDSQFLSENLVIFPTTGNGPKYSFLFTRSRAPLVEQIAQSLRDRLGAPAPTVIEAPEAVLVNG